MKQLASWKIAALYYLIYLGASTLLGKMFLFLLDTYIYRLFPSEDLANTIRLISMLFIIILSINIATGSITKLLKQDKIFEVIRWVLIFLIVISLLHILFLFLSNSIDNTQSMKLNLISIIIKDAINVFLIYFISRIFLQKHYFTRNLTCEV
ncbi:MAG: hypothetical protein KatS3mg089_0158 [Patescibacteria group bacterium]|nr:MAG: hypothetical protein KatS3mg089_0158 [Patescibacteria group bacterium]